MCTAEKVCLRCTFVCTRAVSQYTVTTACECVTVALGCVYCRKSMSETYFCAHLSATITHSHAVVTVYCDTALVHTKVRLRHTFSAVHTPQCYGHSALWHCSCTHKSTSQTYFFCSAHTLVLPSHTHMLQSQCIVTLLLCTQKYVSDILFLQCTHHSAIVLYLSCSIIM